MDLTNEAKQRVEGIADDTLTQFERIAQAATDALARAPVAGAGALANVNTLTSTSAIETLGRISEANRASYYALTQEPSIARVAVVLDSGEQRTYYICRATPIAEIPNLASYRAPVGRLASLPVGEEFSLPNGTVVTVLERAQLRPAMTDQRWDSRDTVIESDEFGAITVESLRGLLETISGEKITEDLVQQLLSEEREAANVVEGIRRSLITKMALRDQPVLDKYQDEIFRLPLDSQLLLLGPPGTGKTTTLIRRLGQKRAIEFLNENEKRAIKTVGTSDGDAHADSWLMFTPTELLKQYLKEAFARENVPASDLHIRTWSDYRRELGRTTFGVLRTASGTGTFVLKDTADSLAPDALSDLMSWFSDFDQWQRSMFLHDLRLSADGLSKNQQPEVSGVGKRLLSIVESSSSNSIAAALTALMPEVETVRNLVASMKESTDNKIHGALNLQHNRDKNFIDSLAKFIDSLQLPGDTETEDLDDQDGEEEELTIPRTGRAAAASAYMLAVRAQARAYASRRRLGRNSRNGAIIEWLGERGLSEGDRAAVGARLLVQTNARRFVNPVQRYLGGMPRQYRAFRRLRQEERRWYRGEGFSPTDLNPLELDLMLLAVLRGANDLLGSSTITPDIERSEWSSLKRVIDLQKNQILVDEATDFSPVQLACMAALSPPRIRSFFACGDFNQRLTIWGSRSVDDVRWAVSHIDVKEITVSYRHSRQLIEFARAIVRVSGGSEHGATLPKHVDSEGVSPALFERASTVSVVVDWLAQRICEIERSVKQLPSIAVFVESEAHVQSLAEALKAALADANIQVVACPNGQVMGQDNDVRVFDVQHIKGLEFEAVFFVGVDRLAALQPRLFNNYLYVGTTRAATYLGITCDDVLPPVMLSLRPMFVADWTISSGRTKV